MEKRYVEEYFPMQDTQGYTYELLDIYRNHHSVNESIVDIIDDDGYKYRIALSSLKNRVKDNKKPSRFLFRSPYIIYNINRFLIDHDIPLRLTHLSENDHARSQLMFYRVGDYDDDIYDTELFISWNKIQSDPERFKNENINDTCLRMQAHRLTKEDVIYIIQEKEKQLCRPLLQADFEGHTTCDNDVGIRVIWKYWGSFKNMISDLGLMSHDNYYKPNASYFEAYENYQSLIKRMCHDIVKNENRHVIMAKDFESVGLRIGVVRRRCERDNLVLEDILAENECTLQIQGCGFNYTFEDGECVTSNYEYLFSQLLRKNGLKYNIDFERDYLYSNLDKSYDGKMNCDYKIYTANYNCLYIELAGILCYPNEILAYKNDVPLKSKRKERYRLSLYQKKKMLDSSNVDYLILFPQEITEENLQNIIDDKILSKRR